MTRITFEILRPIPIAPLTCAAGVVRPGRSVELVEGALSHEGLDLIRARAWRIRTVPPAPSEPSIPEEPPPPPARGETGDYFPTAQETGWHTAMEMRFLSGGYTQPGPARAWLRMRGELVDGEEPSPLDRLLVAADAGNGVSSPLDYRRYVFINTDLSVALRRLPAGAWVCLDSASYAEPDGVGFTDTALLDERGLVGRASQSLLVAVR